MELKNYPRLFESVWRDTLPNGLQIVLVPRKGFSRKIAYLVTGAGALHRSFTMDGKEYLAPMGVAHYLEHKLFDMPGRDVSAEFAAMGASVNAFTSYDMTAYYFSCTENFEACLNLLMEFVTTPYFTEESVQKEQGIIGQEIDMNDDAPESRIFDALADAMYYEHPIREPILGTRQTIAQITPQVLYDCHRALYHPNNMLLCVVADMEPELLRALALQGTKNMPCPEVTVCRQWQEPHDCRTDLVRMSMEVSRPMFQIGFKCDELGTGEAAVVQEFIGDLAAEALFGESSELYLQLYEQGIIDPSFGGGLDTLPGVAMLSASGESEQPEMIRSAILARAEKLVQEGIPESEFLRMKRSSIGSRIRGLDSFDSLCFRICAYHFSNFDYFLFPQIYDRISAEDVRRFIEKYVTPDRCTMAIIDPKEEV